MKGLAHDLLAMSFPVMVTEGAMSCRCYHYRMLDCWRQPESLNDCAEYDTTTILAGYAQ